MAAGSRLASRLRSNSVDMSRLRAQFWLSAISFFWPHLQAVDDMGSRLLHNTLAIVAAVL